MTDQTSAPAPPGGSGNEVSGGRPGGGGGRRRQPPVLVKVASVSHVTPRLVSVRVTAEDMSRFAAAAPTAHIKLFLPAPGQDAPTMPIMTPEGRVWPEDQPRPIVRTYTPRAYDPQSNTLEVQFLLHGVGPASEWAQNAAPGDKLAIGGPGGRFNADSSIARWWIAGDESALPAVGTLLDSLPASASAEVHLEVEGPDDEIPLTSAAAVTVVWHHRRNGDAFGAELYDAATAAAITEDTHVWVACEASAVRRIRSLMLGDKEVPASRLVTRGYWRIGAPDHPDHDYGED
jgi:NADPH-dependent ferric siderophore reductase